jgi:hypothetical protein
VDSEEIRQSLQVTRMKRKESHWEEHLLETRLHYVDLHQRIEESRRLLQTGAYADAKNALTAVIKEVESLPPRYDALKNEVEILGRELELVLASRDAEQILATAELEFAAQKYPEVGARLQAVAQRLGSLPAEGYADLHERFRRINELFEAHHRSFVDLFNTLRRSFVVKIQQRYDEIREQASAGKPVDPGTVRDLLLQVALAESNLGIIQRDKIGPTAYDRTKKDLHDQRAALEALLKAK